MTLCEEYTIVEDRWGYRRTYPERHYYEYPGVAPPSRRRYPEDYYGVYVFTDAIRRSADRCDPVGFRITRTASAAAGRR